MIVPQFLREVLTTNWIGVDKSYKCEMHIPDVYQLTCSLKHIIAMADLINRSLFAMASC